MKVLIIHNAGDSSLPSGELVVARNEKNSLIERGVLANLHVINNREKRNILSLNNVLTGLNLLWSIPSFRLMNNLIDAYTPDVVHFHGVLPLLTPSVFYACKKRGKPVVQTLHNYRWFCVEGGLFRNNRYCDTCVKSVGLEGVLHGCSRGSKLISFSLWLVNFFYRKTGLLYSWVDRFVSVSEFVRDKHIEAGFPKSKIRCKYNAAPDIPAGSPIVNVYERKGITFVGRVAPAKGTKVLKEIARSVALPINIIGNGPDLPDLKRFCNTYNLGHVKFLGRLPREEVIRIMVTSQCVVVPSNFGEPFPLVIIEAMACGTPVIGSNIAGPAEIIKKSKAGILADPDCPATFVNAIHELVKDPNMIDVMGMAGRKYVRETLTNKINTDKLVSIYKEVIREKRG